MTLIDADHSQFVVSGLDADLVGPWPVDNELVTFTDDMSMASVSTGAQWGNVEVEAVDLNSAPPVGDVWEDIVEFSCASPSGLAVAPLMDSIALVVADRGGQWRVRVSARGRNSGWERNSEELVDPDLGLPDPPPVEFFLIEAWPAPPAEPHVIRMTNRLEEPSPEVREALPGEHAAVAAAETLAQMLDQRPFVLPDIETLGTAYAEVTVAMPRRRLFRYISELNWVTCWGFGHLPDGVRLGYGDFDFDYSCYQRDQHPSHRFVGSDGSVRGATLKKVSPHLLVRTWGWYLPPIAGQSCNIEELLHFPVPDSQIRFELTPVEAHGANATRLTVTHSSLPASWVDPMKAIWQLALSEANQDAPDHKF